MGKSSIFYGNFPVRYVTNYQCVLVANKIPGAWIRSDHIGFIPIPKYIYIYLYIYIIIYIIIYIYPISTQYFIPNVSWSFHHLKPIFLTNYPGTPSDGLLLGPWRLLQDVPGNKGHRASARYL